MLLAAVFDSDEEFAYDAFTKILEVQRASDVTTLRVFS